MSTQVQIDKSLFVNLCEYFFNNQLDPTQLEILEETIEQALDGKIDKILNRAAFTKYKTAKTLAEREQNRKEYLDRCGVHKSFRSHAETSFRQARP